ncbi:MAG: SpaH/EbpB family LPXTG-anchored major pilin [Actinomycetaceae bacterium]|nr:SpaH/EbpB family LPXTG-anchored major pilin [Actinomycetaceae bacterium]
MSTLRTISRRIILAFSAAMLAIAPSVIASPQAHAATPADIDFNAKGSITIHKYENPAWADSAANGQVLNAPASAKPIQGVTFTVRRMVNFDLRRQGDWDRLTQHEVGYFSQSANGTPVTQVTDASGTTTFSNLPVGAYYVTESNAPANVHTMSPPFIVTIPHPSQGQGGTSSWVYDVHVYPKNTVKSDPVKTLDDSKAFLKGDDISWTIDQVIPAPSVADPLTSITLIDELPYGFTYKSAKVYVNGVEQTLPITHDRGTVTANVASSVAGFGAGNTIRLEITTTASDGGARPNRSETQFRTKNGFSRAYSNTVTSPWAFIDILKVEAGTTTGLKGAQFELYKDAACTPTEKVEIDPQKLLSQHWGDLPDPLLVKARAYYVKEVNPPSGYLVPANNCMKIEPSPVDNNDDDRPKVLQVENVKAAAPPLPATGANGELLLAIGGGVVILTGLGIVFVALRRRAKN